MRPNQTSSSFFVSRVPPTTTNNAMFLPEHPNILEQTANPTSHLTNTPPTFLFPAGFSGGLVGEGRGTTPLLPGEGEDSASLHLGPVMDLTSHTLLPSRQSRQ